MRPPILGARFVLEIHRAHARREDTGKPLKKKQKKNQKLSPPECPSTFAMPL